MRRLPVILLVVVVLYNQIVYTQSNGIDASGPYQYNANSSDTVDMYGISSINTDTKKNTAPFLIPFDHALFKRYCATMVQRLYATYFAHLNIVCSASTVLAMCCVIPCIGYVKNVIAAETPLQGLREAIGMLTKNIDFSSLWAGGGTLIRSWFGFQCMASLAGTVTACLTSTRALYTVAYQNELESWEQKAILSTIEQEQIWHELIYEHFGNPVVINSTITSGSYHLVFEKKYGAGQIHFNPNNREQVIILLGIHTSKHDDLRCDTIRIVPGSV
jgi:hypothetical protein